MIQLYQKSSKETFLMRLLKSKRRVFYDLLEGKGQKDDQIAGSGNSRVATDSTVRGSELFHPTLCQDCLVPSVFRHRRLGFFSVLGWVTRTKLRQQLDNGHSLQGACDRRALSPDLSLCSRVAISRLTDGPNLLRSSPTGDM